MNKAFVVYGIIDDNFENYQNFEVGTFSTKEKAERCLNLCQALSNQVCSTDKDGSPEDGWDGVMKAHPLQWATFDIYESTRPALDKFTFDGHRYDWSRDE